MASDRFKNFDAINAAKAEEKKDPPSFKLSGVDFECVVAPKATSVAKLSKAGEGDVTALIDYLRSLIVPAQRVEFDVVLDDDEKVVEIETLAELVTWLAEEYTGRPTKSPSR